MWEIVETITGSIPAQYEILKVFIFIILVFLVFKLVSLFYIIARSFMKGW